MSSTVRPPVDGGSVLVTGASPGIGRELAVGLAARAGTLVLLARRTELLEQLKSELVATHPRLRVERVRPGRRQPGRDRGRAAAVSSDQRGPVRKGRARRV